MQMASVPADITMPEAETAEGTTETGKAAGTDLTGGGEGVGIGTKPGGGEKNPALATLS